MIVSAAIVLGGAITAAYFAGRNLFINQAVSVPLHTYEVRPRKDGRGADLVSDALPFGRLWYDGPNAVTNATGYAMHDSRSADAVIRVYDEAGNDRMRILPGT